MPAEQVSCGLVGLHLNNELPRELFVISKNLLTLGGTVPAVNKAPSCQSTEKIKGMVHT